MRINLRHGHRGRTQGKMCWRLRDDFSVGIDQLGAAGGHLEGRKQ